MTYEERPAERTPKSEAGDLSRALRFALSEGAVKWTNPTKDFPAKLSFFLTDPITRSDITYDVTIAPGETVELPAVLSTTIHQMRDGMVQGGACPWLVREGQRYGVHPSLEPPAKIQATRSPWFPK